MLVQVMENHLWWQKGVIYQIYPLSFADSNGDGYGDLPGIAGKLDYLEWLGVNAIWLSPIYPSPMADGGYDVSDYTGIHPWFGTMKDFDRLLRGCHDRGMKLILDYVPNHSSDQHAWFLESRSSRENPKRDWYIWRDGDEDGGPPNNWLSSFGGGAWEWDEFTGQYYLHSFLKEQPDLNWRNPEVQQAMLDVLQFWLDKGVDGFRIDALSHVMKDEQFRDNPLNPRYDPEKDKPHHQLIGVYSGNQAEVHDIVTMMRQVADQYDERMLIGELYLPVGELVEYYGRERHTGLHLPYNFQLVLVPWDTLHVFAGINMYEASLPPFGWPNWVLGNHDKPRVLSRIGPAQARVAAMLLLTLRGTPTMYYGDEIGMHDVKIPPEQAHDPVEKAFPGRGFGRDPARTPMQWAARRNAGFSTARPWLPVADDAELVNVEKQKADDGSMLAFYRRLLKFRQDEAAMQIGRYIPAGEHANMLAFFREHEQTRFLIAANLAGHSGTLVIPRHMNVAGRIALCTNEKRIGEQVDHRIRLGPNEGIIARITPPA
jgi:alpha-glucosidase